MTHNNYKFVSICHDIAKKGHAGQKYGKEDYFQYHICGVVNIVAFFVDMSKALSKDEDLSLYYKSTATAFLHDWLEDCEYKDDHAEGIKYLQIQNVPEDIIEAVVLLTKTKDTVIEEYLLAIRENPLALIVKKADMLFNITNNIKEGNLKRFSKYSEQMKILMGK